MCLTSKYTLRPLAESHLNPLNAQPTYARSSPAIAPNPIVLLANSCLPQTYSFACCFKLCFHHHPFLFGLLGSTKNPRSSLEQSQLGSFTPKCCGTHRSHCPRSANHLWEKHQGWSYPPRGGFFADISLSKLSREGNQLGCPAKAPSTLGRTRENPRSGKTPNSGAAAANPTRQQCCSILASPGWHRSFCASRQTVE